ncbi:MAG: DUF4446 family protein [Solirubrobacteraceae bacterium]|nr:DUF4446 family protein [Solirubrobacteraceae bacterium]
MPDHPDGWSAIATAGLAVAVLALLAVVVLALWVRRLRRAQTAVLGPGGHEDLVAHAARLEARVDEATEAFSALARRHAERMEGIEGALLRVLSRHAMVRYDAYGEQSGHQSCSLALLDVVGDGIVLTSIHHRDQARIYIRRIQAGEPEHRLAPEEEQALALALRRGPIDGDGGVDGTPAVPRPGV